MPTIQISVADAFPQVLIFLAAEANGPDTWARSRSSSSPAAGGPLLCRSSGESMDDNRRRPEAITKP